MKGKPNFCLVDVVEREEAVALLLRQAVEPGGGLLVAGIVRESASLQASGEIRMGVDERELLLAGVASESTCTIARMQPFGRVLRRW